MEVVYLTTSTCLQYWQSASRWRPLPNLVSRVFHLPTPKGAPFGRGRWKTLRTRFTTSMADKSWQLSYEPTLWKGSEASTLDTNKISGKRERRNVYNLLNQNTIMLVFESDSSAHWKTLLVCYTLQTPETHGIRMHVTELPCWLKKVLLVKKLTLLDYI